MSWKKNVLDKLQKLCDEATPGPWEYLRLEDEKNRECNIGHVDSDEGWHSVISRESGIYGPGTSDAEFIIAARRYMPLLIAVARAAQSDMDKSHKMAWAMANNQEIEMSDPSVIKALATLLAEEK